MAIVIVDTLKMVYVARNYCAYWCPAAKIGNAPVEPTAVQHIGQRIVLSRLQVPVDSHGNLARKYG
ncbi:hypothetical protein D3C71_2112710 [compost metagenome]